MKGTHISRNMQRKLRQHTDLSRMSIGELAALWNVGKRKVFDLGYEEAFRRYRYDVERALKAQAELKRICAC